MPCCNSAIKGHSIKCNEIPNLNSLQYVFIALRLDVSYSRRRSCTSRTQYTHTTTIEDAVNWKLNWMYWFMCLLFHCRLIVRLNFHYDYYGEQYHIQANEIVLILRHSRIRYTVWSAGTHFNFNDVPMTQLLVSNHNTATVTCVKILEPTTHTMSAVVKPCGYTKLVYCVNT